MRTAHLIKGLGRGGAEGLLPQTFRAGGPGFSYRVGYFLPWKDALVKEVEAAGAPVRCFGTRSNVALLASVPRVMRWLRESRADLVHAHLPLAGVVARLAGRLAGVPVVYTEHNLQERYHPWTRRAKANLGVAGASGRSVRGDGDLHPPPPGSEYRPTSYGTASTWTARILDPSVLRSCDLSREHAAERAVLR